MKIINDNNCSWVKDLEPRINVKTINKDLNTDWLIVGAGFTGLSAARKLGELFPLKKNNYC